MTKKEKARFVVDELEKLYPAFKIPLDFTSPYTLLIATVLSAQCTDARVNQITPVLFARADNPYDMVKMTVDDIREIIRPCGLSPQKSKAIHGLSKILIEKFKGEVPADMVELEKLPGVGHKTASVVMSQAFHVPAFPVDTHIHRMMTRWGLTNGKSVTQTERDAKALFPRDKWNKLHIQIILYGRECSPARSPSLKRDYITATIGSKKVLENYKP